MRTRRSALFVRPSALAAAVALSAGCFPEDQLHPPRDARADAPRADIVTSDIVVEDVGDIDAVVPMDVKLPDVVDTDAGVTDVPMVPADADLCGMVPSATVPATPALSDLTGVRDMAFDGRGALAVASGDRITLVQRGGATSPLLTGAPGDVTALRYTASGRIVFAASSLNDGGMVSGGIYVLDPSMSGAMPERRFGPTGRVNGLAVHPDGTVFYSDTGASAVFRLSLDDTAAPTRVVMVPAARALALDGAGRTLYVGGAGGVYRVSLDASGDGGGPSAVQIFGGIDTVSGLATDQCDNVWVADERPSPATSRIWRVGAGTEFPTIFISEDGVRAVAFGQGGAFDDRVLYFYQERAMAVRAVGVVARGVPRPVPAP